MSVARTVFPPSGPERALGQGLAAPEQVIDQHLRRTRRQVKWVEIFQGLLVLMVVWLAVLLAAAIADHWLVRGGLPDWARWMIWLALAGWSVVYFWLKVLPLIVYRIHPLYAAQTIEAARPSLRNNLINFLFLRNDPRWAPAPVVQAVEESAAQQLLDLGPEGVVDRQPVIRWGYALAAVGALVALYIILSPKSPFVSFGRMLWPWADIPAPTRVRIEAVQPGDTVAHRGEPVRVSADVFGLADSEEVLFYYSTADGQIREQAIPMKPEQPGQPRYSLPLDSFIARQDTQYYIQAGDARTRTYQIQVDIPLVITADRLVYEYPPYTGLGRTEVLAQGDIRALEGTKVTIHASANQPLSQAEIDLDGQGRWRRSMRVEGKSATGQLELRLHPEDPLRPEYTSYLLRAQTLDGRTNPRPNRYMIEVLPDRPPRVSLRLGVLEEMPEEIELPRSRSVEMHVEAEDPDFGLRRVAIQLQKQGQMLDVPPLLDWKAAEPTPSNQLTRSTGGAGKGFGHTRSGRLAGLSSASSKSKPDGHQGLFQASWQFQPTKLGLKPGDVVFYWTRAEDTKLPQPNVAETPRRRIVIVEDPTGQPPPEGQPPPGQAGPGQQMPAPGQQPDMPPQQPPDQQQQPDQQPPQSQEKQPQERPSAQGPPGQEKAEPQAGPQQKQPSEQPQQTPSDQQPTGINQKEPGQKQPAQQTPPSGQSPPGQEKLQPGQKEQPGQDKPEPGQKQSGQETQEPGQKQPGQQMKESGQKEPGQEKPSPTENQPVQEKPSSGQQTPKPEQGSESGQGSTKQPPSGGQESPSSQQPSSAGQEGASGRQPPSGGQETPSGKQPPSDGNEASAGKQLAGGEGQQEGGQQGGQIRPQDSPTAGQPTGRERPASGPEADRPKPPPQRVDPVANPGRAFEEILQDRAQQEAAGKQPSAKPDTQPQTKPAPQPDRKESQPESKPGLQPDAPPEGIESPSAAGKEKPSAVEAKPTPGQPKSVQPVQQPGSEKPQLEQGPPEAQEANQPRARPPGQKPAGDQSSQESQSPSISKKQSDSRGNESGDRSGGGQQGGGQQAPQPGAGAPGSQSPADQGGGISEQPGAGEQTSRPGQQDQAPRPTGSAGQERGPGQSAQGPESGAKPSGPSPGKPPSGEKWPPEGEMEAGKEKPSGQTVPKPPGQLPEGPERRGGRPDQPSTPTDGSSSEKPSAHGAGNPETGGQPGQSGGPLMPNQPLRGDDPNLEYTRQAVDMALEHLRDRLRDGDLRILEKLRWSREDAESFLRRWEELKRQAAEAPPGSPARKQLDDVLKNLGLRPRGVSRVGVEAKPDQLHQMREGRTIPPPPEWAEQFRAFRRGIRSEGTEE